MPSVELPQLRGPVRVPGSHAYRSALDPESSISIDLDALGYVEEEWFVEGRADAHDPDHGLLATAAPYTTRLLVRRPADPARSSGTVHLEPLHNLRESSPTWNTASSFLAREGHTWIGVTVSAGTFMPAGSEMGGGVTHLQHVDAARYRDLSLFAFDVAPSRVEPTGPGGFDPEEMRWNLALATAHGVGAMAGIAALLRSGGPAAAALVGPRVERLLASGWSQTGLFWSSFLERGYHEATRAGATPAIDGYLVAVAPDSGHHPADAILVNLLSEAEVVGTLNPGTGVAPDSDAPPFRGYEVPGTFHLWNLAFGGPFRTQDHGLRHNDRSWYLLVHALLAGIERWSHGGAPLPHEPRIARDADAPDGVARDAHGNALGGVRTPWVDVPSARYLPRCECSPTVGEMRPFDDAAMALVHGDGSRRAETWAAAVDALLERGWLLPDDADALRAQPE